MPLREKSQIPFENRILGALPPEEYVCLSPYLELVRLPASRTLFEAGGTVRHAYFLTGGMVSLLSMTERGATIEVGAVGNEGVVGLPPILRDNVTPYRAIVQIPAIAVRIPARGLRSAFDRGGRFQDLLLRYTNTHIAQLSQSAACNRYHSMKARLCRWLLVSHDCALDDTLDFTQEFLSQMIGAPRPHVSIAAGHLQRAGAIRYSRGRIRILNRQRLEACSCECYRMDREQMGHFLTA
jgi:CRP-like cAMP-binding protein